MIYPIYVYGSPVLRREVELIQSDFPELDKLIDDMFETMYSADGVGLAAPQIGKSLSLFVVDASPWAEEDPSLAEFKHAFINAEIYEHSQEEGLFNEGCLSVPGIHEDVSRPLWIRMRYLDRDFKAHDELFEGYAARVIQHEYDHLLGEMFVDHLSPLRKTLLKSKLTGMSKGKFKAGYKTR